jgi:hypothetical protein
MSAMTFFYQECPVCGRSLRVPVKHFGRQMSCSHCQGEFSAGKEALPEPSPAPAIGPAGELPLKDLFIQPQLGEA